MQNKTNILNSDVYLVQTEKGPRLFYSFNEAKEAALKNSDIIVCGGAL